MNQHRTLIQRASRRQAGLSAKSAPGSASGLRIALFSGNYNCVRDGANRALNRLVAFLLEEGAAVRVYSPTSRVPAFEPAGDLVSVPSFGIPLRSEYRIAPGLTRSLRTDIKRFAPTHFHLSAPDWLGTSAQAFAKQLGVPVVISHHTQFEAYLEYYHLTLLSSWMRRRLDRFYGGADFILAPNRPIADTYRAKGWGEKVGIWGRGVDRAIFAPQQRSQDWRRQLGYGDDEPVLLFFGRTVMEKGLEVFAQSVDLLRRRGHRVRPLVVGDGPALDWFKSRLGESTSVGHLDGADLGRAVASADILVNPSDTEAFGNVNLEAMASGLAIVSADVGSARALIDNGVSGLLVPAREPQAYAAAAAELMASDHRRARLGRAALEASRSFNWPDILGEVVHSYRKVGAPA